MKKKRFEKEEKEIERICYADNAIILAENEGDSLNGTKRESNIKQLFPICL